jgi:hypothetical protein
VLHNQNAEMLELEEEEQKRAQGVQKVEEEQKV